MKFDMVFEGGGAKGMVFVGAMEAFEGARLTFDRLVGSSAGAITAALLAAGYSAAEMQAALNEKVGEGDDPVFSTFMSRPDALTPEEINASGVSDFLRNVDMPLTPEFVEKKLDSALANAIANNRFGIHLFSLVDKGGLFAADNFVEWLEKRLDTGQFNGKKRNFSQMTLQQFFKVTGRYLTVTGSDVTANRLLVLNHNTAPDLPLVWAVRMSMSIPFLWQEVVWRPKWGLYKPDLSKPGVVMDGHAIVDGGLLSNFPIELLVSREPQVEAVMGKRSEDDDENIVGLLIDDKIPVPNAPDGEEKASSLASIGSLQTARRLRGIINTVTAARDKMVINAFEEMVVRLPSGGYGTTEFGMSDGRRAALVGGGRSAMQTYINNMGRRSFQDPRVVAAAEKEADKIALGILLGY